MDNFIRNRRRIAISISEPGYTGSYLYNGDGTYIRTMDGQVPDPALDRILSDLCCRQPDVSGDDVVQLEYQGIVLNLSLRRYIDLTLGEIVDFHAENTPDQEAVVDCFYQRRMTYRELKEESDGLAKALIGLGLEHGDHVAVIMDNSWENVVSKLAIVKAGGVIVNINIHEKAEVLETLLYTADVKMVMLRQGYKAREYMDMFYQICSGFRTCGPDEIACSQLPKLKRIIVTDRTKPRSCAYQFEDLLEDGIGMDDSALAERRKILSPFDYGTIIHTSGTSGVPKGVIMKQYQMVESAWSHVLYFELQKTDRYCMTPPMFHSLGSIGSTWTTLLVGATLICFSKVEDRDLFSILEKESATVFCSVPTIYFRLLNVIKEEKLDCSGLKIRVCTTAGAACAKSTLMEMKQILGAEMIISMYGMTEAGPGITSTSKGDDLDRIVSSVGEFWPGIRWEIRDLKTGKPVGAGEEGEVCIKGFGVMEKYYNNPVETEKAIDQDGWLHSGDIGVVSEDGYLSLKGRCKDLIIHGGENISPKEVEEFLKRYDNIKEAAVVGMPDEQFGENICAFVTLEQGQDLDVEAVKTWCRGKIATIKIPHEIRVLEELPLTATGKIAKGQLRDMVRENLS